MRYKRLILTLASSLLLITCRLEAQVTQEIIYHCKDAGEVYLVWGINNWGLPSEKAVPGNSQVKEALVYSKMIKHGDSFHLNLNLPANTILDYVFLISKDKMSAPVEIWDTNSGEGKKDYHTVIGKDSKAEIFSSVKIESSGRALVKPRDGLLASGMKLCLFSAALLLLCSIFLRKITAREDRLDPYLSIVLQFFVLSFFLLFIRAAVMGHNWSSGSEFIDILPGLSAGFFSDLLLVAICMGLMLCVALLLRRSAVLNHLPAFNLFICAVVLICCAVNIKTVQLLGRPLNYQWLYYSDFLGSSDAKNAIVSNISEELVYNLSAVLISFLILCFIPKNLLPALGSRGKRIMLGGLLLCTGAALAYTYTAAGNAAMPASRTENPLISFITSLEPFAGQPSLFSMGTKEKFAPPSCSCTQSCPIDNRDIRNVIVYVLESTPAEYLQPYSERYKATPVLKSLMSQSWVFNNIYAHAPATNKSLVTLLCSLYPWLSFNSISQEHPDIKAESLSGMLSANGYRCGFFNAGDNRFQNAGEFLKNRSFHTVSDYRDLPGSRIFTVNDKKWANLDGADDEALVDGLSQWLGAGTDPFFAMLWTYQTHYPYFVTGEKKVFTEENEDLNRYLNALNHSDMVLGKLMDLLRRKKLDKSTLVIVVGDHGEAFGRHNQTTHASGIYEENLHVPFIMIHPSLEYKRFDQLGGLVDIAPTVASVLGRKAPATWQGKSLFDEHRTNRVYFFAPWSEYLFGFRDRNMKFIYNASTSRAEIYDLDKDPFENVNLADQLHDQVRNYTEKLAVWVQYQDKFIKQLLNKH